MPDAYIVDAVRSPIGRKNGTLASVRADELAGQVLNGLVERVGVDPSEIEDVQMGCVSQVGEQALNVGRVALLVAGWPETVCAATTDRQCGSSMQTAFSATAAVQAGHLDVVVAAGVENMSRVPMGSNLGPDGFAGFSEKLFERWEIVPQGISAEVLADEWNLSREALDAYSYESHRRAIEAIDEGRFEQEIVPIKVTNPSARSRSRLGCSRARLGRESPALTAAEQRREGGNIGDHRFPMSHTVRRRRDTEGRHVAREACRTSAAFQVDIVSRGQDSSRCVTGCCDAHRVRGAARGLDSGPDRFVSFGSAASTPAHAPRGPAAASGRSTRPA